MKISDLNKIIIFVESSLIYQYNNYLKKCSLEIFFLEEKTAERRMLILECLNLPSKKNPTTLSSNCIV